jgi:hypothetical protein
MTTTTKSTVKTVATVKLFERGLSALRVKVAKLNKRAARHGMVPLELRIVSAVPTERKIDRAGAKMMVVPDVLTEVEIVGCEPCINGYSLLAKIEFNDLIGNVVRIAPGTDDDGSFERYRTVGPVCEHCNSNRKRNDIFVIADEAGRRKLVGRNCLADYVRDGDANTIAVWAEFADQLSPAALTDDDGDADWRAYTGDCGNPTMHLGGYLRIVALVKRKFGWMGRTAARASFDGIATADDAARYIYGRGRAYDRWVSENELYVNDDDADYADRAIAWAAGLDSTGKSEYIDVISKIARAGYVDMRKLDGYAASILVAYDKDRAREIERKERAAGAKNKVWYGEEGKRSKGISVKCIGRNSWEGQYGVTTLVRFEHYPNDTDKAVLVWFASGDRYNDWKPEAEYTVDAMIKDHDDHDKYGKQTKINRVKVISGPIGGDDEGADDDHADQERLAGHTG